MATVIDSAIDLEIQAPPSVAAAQTVEQKAANKFFSLQRKVLATDVIIMISCCFWGGFYFTWLMVFVSLVGSVTPLFHSAFGGDPATEKERYLRADLAGCFCCGLRGMNITLAGLVVCSILENCYIWHLHNQWWGANNIANLVSIFAALVLLVLSRQSQKCLEKIGLGSNSVHAEQPVTITVLLADMNPQPSYTVQQQDSPISVSSFESTQVEKKHDSASEDEHERIFKLHEQQQEHKQIGDVPVKPTPDAKGVDEEEFQKAQEATVKKVDDDND